MCKASFKSWYSKKGKTNNKMIRNDKLIHVRKQHKNAWNNSHYFIENDEDDLQFPFVSFLNYNKIHFMLRT